jgi:hypothetical protein
MVAGRHAMRTAWREVTARGSRRFAGYPLATIAFYGPDDRVATKVAVGIVRDDAGEVTSLQRWHTADGDVRDDPAVATSILTFMRAEGVRSVVMVDRIIGCPHEEGVDYPLGATCPECPYWAERDRWTGERIADGDDGERSPDRFDRKGSAIPTLVADMRHYLDDDGELPDLPGPALSVALHQGAIVAWMTAVVAEEVEVTNVSCRRRPNRRRCRGLVVARFHPETDAIEWRCPVCGDNGIIYGWAGTLWDRTPAFPDLERAPPN